MGLSSLFLILLVILLVVILALPEGRGGLQRGDDWLGEMFRGGQLVDYLLRNVLLLFIGIENRRAVLRAYIRPLPIQLRRVMRIFHEKFHQLAVARLFWIEGHLNSLGMAAL